MDTPKCEDKTDENIAELFHEASHEAYTSAVQAGIPVTVVEDGAIYRIQKINDRITRHKLKDLDGSRFTKKQSTPQ